MTSIQKKWLYRALIMLIFIFAFGIRVHHLEGKKGFHMDEVLSIIIVGNADIGWKTPAPEGEYTGEEIESMIFTMDSSLKGTVLDVLKLWDSNRDSPHTSFYYILQRAFLLGIDVSSVEKFKEDYIFRAGALNLSIFVFTYFAFFALLSFVIKDKTLVLLGLIIGFLNKIDISNALFFRPYALQGLFVIIFTGFLIWVSKKIAKDEYKETWQNLFIFALPLSLMLLTGYYAFIYAFFLGICFVAFPLRKAKKLNLITFFFFGAVLAVLYDLLFYNDFMAGFYSYRTFGSLGVSSSSKPLSIASFGTLFEILETRVFYISSLILLIIAIAYKLKKKESFKGLKTYGWVVLAAFLASATIMLLAPYKEVRYISAYTFILILFYPLVLLSIRNVYVKRGISMLIALVFFVIAIKANDIAYKYDESNASFPSCLKADGLYEKDVSVYLYLSRMVYSNLMNNNLDKEQKFIVCNSTESLLKQVEDKDCIVLFNKNIDTDLDLDLLQYNFEKLPLKMPAGIGVYKSK